MIAVIVCAFGVRTMTEATVDDVLREPDAADLYLVDNAGTYKKRSREHVLRPRKNLGWLRGTNLGIREAATVGYNGYLLLNNDTRLSPGFVAGLAKTLDSSGAGIVGPCYDDESVPHQHSRYFGPASTYQPDDVERDVPFVDGTALLLSDAARRSVGLLDERRFAKFGWGADIDLAFRVHRAGYRVVVTEQAYCNHIREGSFEPSAVPAYRTGAEAEMEAGMRAKWGPNWRAHAGMPSVEPVKQSRSIPRRAVARARGFVSRSG